MELLSELYSSVQIAFLTAVSLSALALAISMLYFAGCYFGSPIGVLLLGGEILEFKRAQEDHSSRPIAPQTNANDKIAAWHVGVMLSVSLFVVMVGVEAGIYGTKVQNGETATVGFLGFQGLLLKTCLEAVLTLIIVRAAVGAGEWLWTSC